VPVRRRARSLPASGRLLQNPSQRTPTGDLEHEQQHQDEKLFDLPPIEIDTSKPTLIHVVLSGEIKLDMSQADDVAFYNALQPGKLVTRETTFFVKGARKVHRRDADGNVDAVVETKSLVVDGVGTEDA
jgi:hypothetical protein